MIVTVEVNCCRECPHCIDPDANIVFSSEMLSGKRVCQKTGYRIADPAVIDSRCPIAAGGEA